MAPVVHILDMENRNSLCSKIGGSVYNPIKSNCEDCIEAFKILFPSSYEAWKDREFKPNAIEDVEYRESNAKGADNA